jgi:tRNA (guanine26-N2/guanine27-N2)-dimethyltransferase
MAGCGIRSLRYGVEAGAAEVWANDADPDRLALLQANLAGFGGGRLARRARPGSFRLVALRASSASTAIDPRCLRLSQRRCPRPGGPRPSAARRISPARRWPLPDRPRPAGGDPLLGAAARADPASSELGLRCSWARQAAPPGPGPGAGARFSFERGPAPSARRRGSRKPGGEPGGTAVGRRWPTAMAAATSRSRACCSCVSGALASVPTQPRPASRFPGPSGSVPCRIRPAWRPWAGVQGPARPVSAPRASGCWPSCGAMTACQPVVGPWPN